MKNEPPRTSKLLGKLPEDLQRGLLTKLPGDLQRGLLTKLPGDLQRGLFAKGRTMALAADQTLFLSGDAGDGCYRIDEGLLKVSVVAPTGAERILAILGPGAIVGELSMISGKPRSASVAAIREASLCYISRTSFESFARDNIETYQHLIRLLAQRLTDTNEALAATTFLTLQGRAARALLSLAEGFGHDVGNGRILIRQKITQSDLAAMAGIARENASRILKDWTRRTLVSRLAGYYCVENRVELEREAAM